MRNAVFPLINNGCSLATMNFKIPRSCKARPPVGLLARQIVRVAGYVWKMMAPTIIGSEMRTLHARAREFHGRMKETKGGKERRWV